RSKISKRKNPVSLVYYREAGFLPAAIVNFLGLLGGGMPAPSAEAKDAEQFGFAEMVERFQFERIHLGGPVFDLEKLRWLNGVYLRRLAPEAFFQSVRNGPLADEYLRVICPLVQERIETLGEFFDLTDFFFRQQLLPPPEVWLPKKRDAAAAQAMVAQIAETLEAGEWTREALEAGLRALAQASGWTAKEVFMLLRGVITGKTASPPLLESLVVLGRARSLDRLRQFLAAQR
ncbi:MAG: glutamate--tRNA ligase, partial [Terriglobales bacterium]